MKCVYTAIMSLDPTGKGQARWTTRWKTALNAFDIPLTVASPQPASNPNQPSYTARLTVPVPGSAL